VFGNVTRDMTIAREEIFGPVLSILPYDSEEEAIDIANDTVYGLAAYVQGKDLTKVREVAAQMRAGSVYINYPDMDFTAPFGGYKQSGNGREYADFALNDFLEIKGLLATGVRKEAAGNCLLCSRDFLALRARIEKRSLVLWTASLCL
jgi:aldehyde dehydrogenase (NAD+)